MNKNLFKISPGFEDIMPAEYRELVHDGPYGKNLGVSDLGTFKELLEEHPLCAGCGLALSLRLILASLPNPEDTIIVGSTGCSSLAFPQVGVHNIHSLFGNQNAVASGLKRALKLRFPEKTKDVVAIAGDGATADIGLDMVMHSWFRRENIATIMLDNEAYANTGGQESGMSPQGTVLYMAPKGKKFPKISLPEIAREVGCAYVAVGSPAQPRPLEKMVRRTILVAREIGPTYLQVFCPCPTNYKFKPQETVAKIKQREKEGTFQTREYITLEAQKLLTKLEEGKK
ncbi:MAG: Oxalate oxidoreductase subunit beta [Actinobacteria bacterium]|uniref:Pyruvate ferredoxin oxidoreductase beta subunit n=6 Tax=Candidatus Hakubella thermalkaliphila TaxID=2754717 RepID=A0A6V8P8W2_9ACTN|nr:thiamine pyrophosphate-dependent enzyme [Candidatus Hakubella thermalkaliphila]MBT9171312.1 Oxalate oxidoreductase subunit beta [Actinomycetota bacterium]GFP27256.1 pyruvate ferredoxin oxidoreductase beta subunit [Candidatus Hakubella thermalkaliphila]GFP30463.1 pyruvate ferredoxin oxidoreductase beta subunit [Candidatus Hakubella thermalkaliphila]GFP43529.1 pyruvate ferredoxin oxidoreductase beta subunit [Candidatus Hakubella thermalkaliphila]